MKLNLLTISFIFYVSTFQAQSFIRDTTFGNGGYANTNYDLNQSLSHSLYKSFLQSDHKFVTYNGKFLNRYNENGTVDTTFGVNGEYALPNDCYVMNVQVHNNDIYLIGIYYPVITIDSYRGGLIMKLNQDGMPDANFGVNGTVKFKLNEIEEFSRICFTTDNKILALGKKYQEPNPYHKILAVKFNLNGTLDTTFQNNGYREYYIFPVDSRNVSNARATADGKIIVSCDGRPNISSNYYESAFFKIDNDGNYDTNFFGTGVKKLGGYYSETRFYDDNSVYVRGNVYVARLNIDTMISEQAYHFSSVTFGTISVSDYVVNDDLSMVLIGTVTSIDGTPSLALQKISHTNLGYGVIDTSFSNGIFLFNLNNTPGVTWQQSRNLFIYDDKILVTGRYNVGFGTDQSGFTRLQATALAVSHSSIKNLAVFPNPAKEHFSFSREGLSFPVNLEIYNALGQKVIGQTINDNGQAEINIGISQLVDGCYFVTLIDAEGSQFSSKIIKE